MDKNYYFIIPDVVLRIRNAKVEPNVEAAVIKSREDMYSEYINQTDNHTVWYDDGHSVFFGSSNFAAAEVFKAITKTLNFRSIDDGEKVVQVMIDTCDAFSLARAEASDI